MSVCTVNGSTIADQVDEVSVGRDPEDGVVVGSTERLGHEELKRGLGGQSEAETDQQQAQSGWLELGDW